MFAMNRYRRTWVSWNKMRMRCLNVNNEEYWRYGGSGITVCERWAKFDDFLADMGERPAGKTIDRIDSAGNYEPANCRWATPREQTLNRKAVKWVEFDGVRQCASDWARSFGVTYAALYHAAKYHGVTVEQEVLARLASK